MSLAQRIRENVAQSRRTTSEILGTAAELVQGHEQALQQLSAPLLLIRQRPWTVTTMKREIGGFRAAKNHFISLYGVKAHSWVALVDKVNAIETALIHLGYRQRLEVAETMKR